MSRVCIDIDGVLRDWMNSWLRIFEQKHGYRPDIKPVWEGPWLALEEAGYEDPKKLLFVEWGWDVTANAEPYPQAKQTIRAMKNKGHTIIIATDQPTDETKAGTLAWLSKHFILPDELVFTSRKYEVEADFYIDDNDRNIFKLALHRPDSHIVRILRPWNKKFNYSGLPILTIKKLMEYVELVNGEHPN